MGILRLIFALSVVAGHTNGIVIWKGPGGLVAVQCFYIISGYYMAFVLDKKYNSSPIRSFYLSRYFRLFPIYIITLLLYFFAAFLLTSFAKIPLSRFGAISLWRTMSENHVEFIFTVLSNIFIFGQDIFMFLGVGSDGFFFTENFRSVSPAYPLLVLPQCWTLGVELLFYMVAPFIVKGNIRRIYVLAAISIALRLFFYSAGFMYDPWVYRFFPFELALFLFGSGAYRLYSKFSHIDVYNNIYAVALSIAILAFCIEYLPRLSFEWKLVLYFIFSLTLPCLFRISKNSAVDRYIGEYSYPIYVAHIPIIRVLMSLGFNHQNLGAWVTALSICLSLALIHLVQIPVDRYRSSAFSSR